MTGEEEKSPLLEVVKTHLERVMSKMTLNFEVMPALRGGFEQVTPEGFQQGLFCESMICVYTY